MYYIISVKDDDNGDEFYTTLEFCFEEYIEAINFIEIILNHSKRYAVEIRKTGE